MKTTQLLTSLLASLFAQRSQARVLGSTVLGGMLAASGIAIFFIPVTFYVVERLPSRKRTGAEAPQPEAKPAAVATTS